MQALVQVGEKFEDFDGLCKASQVCDRLLTYRKRRRQQRCHGWQRQRWTALYSIRRGPTWLVVPSNSSQWGFRKIPKMSLTRISIIEEIRRQNYRRPLNNVVLNLDIRDKDSNSYIVPRDGDGNNIEAEFFILVNWLILTSYFNHYRYCCQSRLRLCPQNQAS